MAKNTKLTKEKEKATIVKTPVQAVKTPVQAVKPPVQVVKPPVQVVKPPVQVVKPPVQVVKPFYALPTSSGVGPRVPYKDAQVKLSLPTVKGPSNLPATPAAAPARPKTILDAYAESGLKELVSKVGGYVKPLAKTAGEYLYQHRPSEDVTKKVIIPLALSGIAAAYAGKHPEYSEGILGGMGSYYQQKAKLAELEREEAKETAKIARETEKERQDRLLKEKEIRGKGIDTRRDFHIKAAYAGEALPDSVVGQGLFTRAEADQLNRIAATKAKEIAYNLGKPYHSPTTGGKAIVPPKVQLLPHSQISALEKSFTTSADGTLRDFAKQVELIKNYDFSLYPQEHVAQFFNTPTGQAYKKYIHRANWTPGHTGERSEKSGWEGLPKYTNAEGYQEGLNAGIVTADNQVVIEGIGLVVGGKSKSNGKPVSLGLGKGNVRVPEGKVAGQGKQTTENKVMTQEEIEAIKNNIYKEYGLEKKE